MPNIYMNTSFGQMWGWLIAIFLANEAHHTFLSSLSLHSWFVSFLPEVHMFVYSYTYEYSTSELCCKQTILT